MVAILDADKLGALTLFDQHRQSYPGRPIIALSVHDIQLKQAVSVRKPFSLPVLMDALQSSGDLCRQSRQDSQSIMVSSQPTATPASASSNPDPVRSAAEAMQDEATAEWCGTAPDRNLDDPSNRRSISFDPNQHLIGQVSQALARTDNRVIALQLSGEQLYLAPERSRAYTTIPKRKLRSLAIMPCTPLRSEELDGEQLRRWLREQKQPPLTLDLEQLLWCLALWGSRGRLPQTASLTEPVRLKYWPNLTRLPRPAHALRIAALWFHEATPLRQTPQRLDIAQRYVFGFYTACETLGLVEYTAAAKPLTSNSTVQRGLLSRIMTALRRAA